MTTLLSLERYLELLDRESVQLANVLRTGQFGAPVDACPGWSLSDLGYHVGDVVRFWTWVVTTGATTTDGEPEFPRPDDANLADWLLDGVHELRATLASADATAPAYSWTPQQDVAFVQRRVPHELSVHRWDAQHAVRGHTGVEAAAIASDLATDGIGEYFLLASSFPVDEGSSNHSASNDGAAVAGVGALAGQRVGLQCTDTGAAWTSWVNGSTVRATPQSPESADVAVTLSGAASDLLLTLWRRMPLDSRQIRVTGDERVATAFLALANLD